MKVVAGIDVGKASLEVSAAAGPTRSFDNNADGISGLRQSLASQGVTLMVCEASGGYERQLLDALLAAEMAVHLAHPNKTRGFARACGHEAKTDQLDAQMLARYGQVFELPRVLAQDRQREELRDLLRRREQLVRQRTQERNRLDKGFSDKVRVSTERHIGWLNAEIDSLDAEYREALRNSAELSQQAALYRSVPGIGEQTAAILAACMPELGSCQGKAVTAPGRSRALVSRQRSQARLSRHSRRSRRSAAGVVHGRAVGHSPQPRPATLLPRLAAARQAGQGGAGGGDAQAAVATQRHCPTWHAVGRSAPIGVLKPLDF